eukprot:1329742-Pyramimonas_sp.AAC.1
MNEKKGVLLCRTFSVQCSRRGTSNEHTANSSCRTEELRHGTRMPCARNKKTHGRNVKRSWSKLREKELGGQLGLERCVYRTRVSQPRSNPGNGRKELSVRTPRKNSSPEVAQDLVKILPISIDEYCFTVHL